MTPINLIDGLVEFIRNAVKDYDMTTKAAGMNKAPSVYAGYLPPENDEDEPLTPKDYPFVLVRYLSDDDEIAKEDTADIRIIIGTHSEDEQGGWRDSLNIATRIKIELKKKQIIGPFALTGTVHTELFEEQMRPYWHAFMDLSFTMPQVQHEMEWYDD